MRRPCGSQTLRGPPTASDLRSRGPAGVRTCSPSDLMEDSADGDCTWRLSLSSTGESADGLRARDSEGPTIDQHLWLRCPRSGLMVLTKLQPTWQTNQWLAECDSCAQLHRVLFASSRDAPQLFESLQSTRLTTSDLNAFVTRSSRVFIFVALCEDEHAHVEELRRSWAPTLISMDIDTVSDTPLWGDSWVGLDLPSEVLAEVRAWQQELPATGDRSKARKEWVRWGLAILEGLTAIRPEVTFEGGSWTQGSS